ncbi:hypothetical protein GCM10010182_27620 [Actinomadura cremea]|nr:hypothetical protein GCM10010182_27620 [Actinomadura cremea]
MDLIVPAGHPLAVRGAARLEDAASESWISVQPESCDHHHRLLAYCAAGFTPRMEHFTTTWSVIWALGAAGLGVSLVPRLVGGPGEGAVRVPLVGESVPRCRLLTCVRRGGRGNPLVERGLQALRDAVPAPCTRLPAA